MRQIQKIMDARVDQGSFNKILSQDHTSGNAVKKVLVDSSNPPITRRIWNILTRESSLRGF